MTVHEKSIGGRLFISSVETHGASAHSRFFLRSVSHELDCEKKGPSGVKKIINTSKLRENAAMVYFGKTWTRSDVGVARCVCVITVTAPLPRRRGPRGISYDHPAASASLGTGDQTNRLPIALPIIGTIDTGARHRASPGIDERPIERLGFWPPSRRTSSRTERLPRQDSRLFLARAITTDAIDLTAGVLTTGD